MVDIREITLTTRLNSQLWNMFDENIDADLWEELRINLTGGLTPQLFLQFNTVFEENMEHII